MSNQLAVTHYLRSKSVQQRVEELLGQRASQFTTSLMSVINTNPVLQECTPETVLKAAITAASMDLPINPNLGFAYVIPYNNKKKIKDENGKEKTVWVMEAQFQMGYKGFIQLAQRSNQFKRINATDVREGEYKGIDRRSGEVDLEFMEDEAEREKQAVVGYLGYFKLLNGFEKELYMTVEDMKKHAKQYSKSYAKGFGMWVDDFDKMAKKTVLKLLISRFGPVSTDQNLQQAVLADQASVGGDDKYNYLDNKPDEEQPEESDDEEQKDSEKKETKK